MTKKRNAPVIPAFLYKDQGLGSTQPALVFWCPYCKKVHWHDRYGGDYLTGHCAQDNPKSPLVDSGYVLIQGGTIDRLEDLRPISEILRGWRLRRRLRRR